MTTENKEAVTLNIFLLKWVDIVDVYRTALEVAKENNGIFQGVYPSSLVNPNRDVEYIAIILELDDVRNVIDKIKMKLYLQEENLLYTIVPDMLPKEKPIPTDAIR